MSINNLVRTQNYKRTVAELESKRAQVSELQQKLAASKTEAESASTKAAAFDVIAESVGLINKIHEFEALSEPMDELPASVFFDNEMNKKILNVKSLTLTPLDEENKYALTATLETEEKIYDSVGKLLCTFKEIKLGTGTIDPADGTDKYGDVKEYSKMVFDYEYMDSASGGSPLIGLSFAGNVYIKLSSLPSFGEFKNSRIEAFVDTTEGYLGENHKYFVVLSLPNRNSETGGTESDDADLTLIPIPEVVKEA